MQKFRLDLTHLGSVKLLLIVFIVCIHASPNVNNDLTYSTAAQIYIAQIISRIAVPLYFFISGYLMVKGLQTYKDWTIKIKKRVHTILVPYIVWNALYGFLLFVLSHQFAIRTSVDSNMTILEALRVIFINPAISPLWFLRDLFFFQIIALLYVFLSKQFRYVFIFAVSILWLYSFHIVNSSISTEGAMFFALGFFYWLPFFGFIKKQVKWFIPIAVVFSVLDLQIRYADYWWSLIFHRITILLLCYSFIYFVTESEAVKRFLNKLKRISKFSFYIFVLHFPLLHVSNHFLDSSSGVQFVLKVLLAVFISIGIGYLINFFPKISGVLTGNRR